MFSCLSCFYLSYTLSICGLFYLVLLASTLSRYSLFCADGTLNPFHSLTPPQHVGLYPRRLVHPKTVWYSFPYTPSLGLHIAVFRVSLHFEPSDHPFPPISPQNIYPHFIEGWPLSTSDFIPVVWFTPKPCGTHFLLPHHLAYILQSLE